MMIPEKRYCKVCNEEIHGRRDKLYCSDYCRATQFNSLHLEVTGLIRRVNYTIRKNRNILEKLNTGGETRVHKRTLIDNGLNFHYFTSVYQSRAGHTYFFCYDQGYREQEGDYFLLIAADHCDDLPFYSRLHRHMTGEEDKLINGQLLRSQVHDA